MSYLRTALLSVLCVFFVTCLSAQKKPQVTVSPEIVLHHGHVDLKGTGLTAKSNVLSHLRRPDGTEFPVLTMYTNDKGEFVHDIDTVVLQPGVHEVWVEDVKAKTTSNIAKFEVTMYSKDLK
jgi:hypothetical protein